MDGKKRTPNFSYSECNLLLDLMNKYKNIIENKKTDTVGRYEKERTWAKVVDEFNQKSGEVYRDKKALMAKYDNLKKSMKKKVCSEKKYASGTGGGPSKPSDYSDIDNRVRDLLGDERVEGLPSRFDNDAQTNQDETNIDADDDETFIELESQSYPILNESVPVVLEDDLDPTWGNYTVEHLRRPKSASLVIQSHRQNCSTPVASSRTSQQEEICQREPDKTIPQKSAIDNYIDKRAELHKTKPYKRNVEKDTWDSVGKAKMELLKLQNEIATEELRQKKRHEERLEEEHQLKMAHMVEIHNLKVKLLQAEINQLIEK